MRPSTDGVGLRYALCREERLVTEESTLGGSEIAGDADATSIDSEAHRTDLDLLKVPTNDLAGDGYGLGHIGGGTGEGDGEC